MTATDLVAVITGLGALLSALAAFVTSLITYARLGQVHTAVDGQTKTLVALTAKASFAEGALSATPTPSEGSPAANT